MPPDPIYCPEFGPERQIQGLPASTPSAQNTAMREDRLEVYYVNGTELARAVRADSNGSFGYQPIQFENISSFSPTLTDDGLRLLFMSDRSGTPKLYETTRLDTALPFVTLTVLGDFGDLRAIDVSGDGFTVFFVEGDGRTLGELLRPALDRAFEPVPFPANTNPVQDIAMSADRLTLYFHRAGSIYSWSRTHDNVPFDEVDRVVFSGTYPDLSRDGLTVTFTRNSSVFEARCK